MRQETNNCSVEKLNESFSRISGDRDIILKIYNFLKAPIPGAQFDKLVQRGFKPSHKYFCVPDKINGEQTLIVPNGLLDFLNDFGIYKWNEVSEFSKEEIDEFFDDFVSRYMPFTPYDYQLRCAKESLMTPKQINKACTSSGKSLILFLIINFLYNKNKRGLLIVPNINLLTQLHDDFDLYFKEDSEYKSEFMESIDKQGGGNSSNFNNFLVISTWQSLMNRREYLDSADFILADECLHPDELVTTNKGDVKISELSAGDLVLTINENTSENEFKPIQKVHKNISSEQMFELTVEDGRKLRITGNHKVYTQSGWKRVDKLTTEDDILSII